MKILTMRIDVTGLNKEQLEELECALCAQYEGVEVGNVTVEVDEESDDSMS